MKLLFKQRLFSWFDSYDIYDEEGRTVYTVKGELSWGHRLKVFDAAGREVGLLQERVLTFLPRFEMYLGGRYMGEVRKEFTLFTPRYTLSYGGWSVEGDIFEWNYRVVSGSRTVMTARKRLLNWTDTYELDIFDPKNALPGLMVVLAIDAAKCSKS